MDFKALYYKVEILILLQKETLILFVTLYLVKIQNCLSMD